LSRYTVAESRVVWYYRVNKLENTSKNWKSGSSRCKGNTYLLCTWTVSPIPNRATNIKKITGK